MASELHPTLKLGHPGMFRLEEVRLAGRHLPYFLWKTGIIKIIDERFKGQGEVLETHHRGKLQVDLNQLPGKLSLLPGAL